MTDPPLNQGDRIYVPKAFKETMPFVGWGYYLMPAAHTPNRIYSERRYYISEALTGSGFHWPMKFCWGQLAEIQERIDSEDIDLYPCPECGRRIPIVDDYLCLGCRAPDWFDKELFALYNEGHDSGAVDSTEQD